MLEDEVRRLRKENERLRMEKAILKKSRGLLRQGRRVDVYRFILAEKANFDVRVPFPLIRTIGWASLPCSTLSSKPSIAVAPPHAAAVCDDMNTLAGVNGWPLFGAGR
jgi:hypothetical protein